MDQLTPRHSCDGRRDRGQRLAWVFQCFAPGTATVVSGSAVNAFLPDLQWLPPYRVLPRSRRLDGESTLAKRSKICRVSSNSTLIYAPEVKFSANRIITDDNLETPLENVFVAGDGAGLSRGLVTSAATGVIAAWGLLKKEGIDASL